MFIPALSFTAGLAFGVPVSVASWLLKLFFKVSGFVFDTLSLTGKGTCDFFEKYGYAAHIPAKTINSANMANTNFEMLTVDFLMSADSC